MKLCWHCRAVHKPYFVGFSIEALIHTMLRVFVGLTSCKCMPLFLTLPVTSHTICDHLNMPAPCFFNSSQQLLYYLLTELSSNVYSSLCSSFTHWGWAGVYSWWFGISLCLNLWIAANHFPSFALGTELMLMINALIHTCCAACCSLFQFMWKAATGDLSAHFIGSEPKHSSRWSIYLYFSF